MRPIKYFIWVMVFRSFMLSGQSTTKVLICYGNFQTEEVKHYDYVILEPHFFNSEEIAQLKKTNKTVLAYISLGEVNEDAAYYKELASNTLGENKQWNSKILNLQNKETLEKLDSLVSQYQATGFDGFFMDNIDNYTQWGPTPENLKYLLDFIQRIRLKFPTIHLMQNAGTTILDKTAPYVNSLAIESVATNYNFETKKYRLRNRDDFEARLNTLTHLEQTHNIPVIPIEYAETRKMKEKIINRYKATDWPLFIGQIELNSLPDFK